MTNPFKNWRLVGYTYLDSSRWGLGLTLCAFWGPGFNLSYKLGPLYGAILWYRNAKKTN